MLAAINYHYIRDSFNFKYPSIFGITPDKFKEQLKVLSKAGQFVTAENISKQISGNAKLPEKSIIITFDDGLKEQYLKALPILLKLKIPAIFFVNTYTLTTKKILPVHKIHILRSQINPELLNTELKNYLNQCEYKLIHKEITKKAIEHYKYDSEEIASIKYILNFLLDDKDLDDFLNNIFEKHIDKPEEEIHNDIYMNTDEVKELYDLGMLGSHSHTHRIIGNLSDSEKVKDISLSQKIIKEITGNNVTPFSFPYGSKESCFSTSEILKSNNFLFAFTMERAVNQDLKENYTLSRFDNNDMPLGKNYKFDDINFFDHYKFRQWKNS